MSRAKINAEPVNVEEVAEASATEVTATETVQTVVYVGPTVPGVAAHNTVFNNGLTAEMSAAIQKEPAFGSLVVPINKLAQASKDIASKSGATYVFYKKAVEFKA